MAYVGGSLGVRCSHKRCGRYPGGNSHIDSILLHG